MKFKSEDLKKSLPIHITLQLAWHSSLTPNREFYQIWISGFDSGQFLNYLWLKMKSYPMKHHNKIKHVAWIIIVGLYTTVISWLILIALHDA